MVKYQMWLVLHYTDNENSGVYLPVNIPMFFQHSNGKAKEQNGPYISI